MFSLVFICHSIIVTFVQNKNTINKYVGNCGLFFLNVFCLIFAYFSWPIQLINKWIPPK